MSYQIVHPIYLGGREGGTTPTCSMNSQLEYARVTQTENDDGLTPPPPPTPRQATFAPSKDPKWVPVVIVVWTFLMLMAKKWLDPYYLLDIPPGGSLPDIPSGGAYDWSNYIPMFSAMIGATAAVSGVVALLLHQHHQLLRRQRLFSNGVATVATVTNVGVIWRSASTFCIAVRWSFIVNGIECTGVTPRDELPNAVVGDRFWVLYEEGKPWYMRRWTLFDSDGNLRSNDFLSWKTETDVAASSGP